MSCCQRGVHSVASSPLCPTSLRRNPEDPRAPQAVVMGTRRSLSVSLKDCGICGSELSDYRRHVGGPGDNGGPGAGSSEAASVQLACKHLFHPSCIKGWTLVGAIFTF